MLAVSFKRRAICSAGRSMLSDHCFSQSFIHAAIHQNRLSGYVGGAVRGQPDDRLGHFARLAETLDTCVGCPGVMDFLLTLSGGGGTRARQFFQAVGSGESGT